MCEFFHLKGNRPEPEEYTCNRSASGDSWPAPYRPVGYDSMENMDWTREFDDPNP